MPEEALGDLLSAASWRTHRSQELHVLKEQLSAVLPVVPVGITALRNLGKSRQPLDFENTMGDSEHYLQQHSVLGFSRHLSQHIRSYMSY